MNYLYVTSALVFLTVMMTVFLAGQDFAIAMSNQTMQQHTKHTFDNLIVSQHIPLVGSLLKEDYLLLMDLTPFATSVEGHSHIAAKIPCNKDGTPQASIMTGIAPALKTLNLGEAIVNGTLDGNRFDFSDIGNSCLYHADLPIGITDIALVNTFNQTLDFDRGGYSITISIHGSAIQHLAEDYTN